MAYVKTVWSTGDTITATLANNWETQYDKALADVQAAANTFTASQTFSATQKVNTVAVPAIWTETDQTGGAGIWRWVTDGGQLRLDRNTAAAGDFSTFETIFTALPGGKFQGKVNVLDTGAGSVVFGGGNQSTFKRQAVEIPNDTRTTNLTYTSGNLTQVTEVDGATTVKTTTLTYNGSQLSSVQVVAGGTTVTSTLNYNADGTLASVTKAVQ